MRRTRVYADEAFVSMDLGTRKAFVVTKADGFDLGSLDHSSMASVPLIAGLAETGYITNKEIFSLDRLPE